MPELAAPSFPALVVQCVLLRRAAALRVRVPVRTTTPRIRHCSIDLEPASPGSRAAPRATAPWRSDRATESDRGSRSRPARQHAAPPASFVPAAAVRPRRPFPRRMSPCRIRRAPRARRTIRVRRRAGRESQRQGAPRSVRTRSQAGQQMEARIRARTRRRLRSASTAHVERLDLRVRRSCSPSNAARRRYCRFWPSARCPRARSSVGIRPRSRTRPPGAPLQLLRQRRGNANHPHSARHHPQPREYAICHEKQLRP